MYVIRILVVYFLYFRLLVNPFFFLFDNIVIDLNSAMERRTRLATLADQVSLFLPFLHCIFVIENAKVYGCWAFLNIEAIDTESSRVWQLDFEIRKRLLLELNVRYIGYFLKNIFE